MFPTDKGENIVIESLQRTVLFLGHNELLQILNNICVYILLWYVLKHIGSAIGTLLLTSLLVIGKVL